MVLHDGVSTSATERWTADAHLRLELEHDLVAGLRGHMGRVEREGRVAADDDLDDVSGERRGRRRRRVGVARVCRRPCARRERHRLRDRARGGRGRDRDATVRGGRDPGCRRSGGGGGVCGGGGGRGGGELSSDGQRLLLEVGEGVRGALRSAVGAEDHAFAAVAVGRGRSLSAVRLREPTDQPQGCRSKSSSTYPDGSGIINGDGVGREAVGLVGGHWHEARVKATLLRGAWRGKRRLGNGMVLLLEVENDLVSDGGKLCGKGVNNKKSMVKAKNVR